MVSRLGRQAVSSSLRYYRQRHELQPFVQATRFVCPWPSTQRVTFCSAGAAEETEEELKQKLALAKEQIEELELKTRHCRDDVKQAQKRHGTDLENESKYAITKFAKEILKVADNLERAAGSVKPEELEQDQDLKKMHAGVTHMQKVLAEALEKFGVVEMKALDAPFNPDQHEAMFAMPMPGKDPNIVFHVMEPGYMIHERTLRAAKVGVTRA
mmetsp:Transcript_116572/g.184458  ORF Transcript_116572/g.184458 Transcript_116572/m.184458 type:complete len:213 (-) Transcript_116572:214-852(-)